MTSGTPLLARRRILGGLAGILAAGVAPAYVGSKILMPVRPVATSVLVVSFQIIAKPVSKDTVELVARGPQILKLHEVGVVGQFLEIGEWRHEGGGQVLIRAA